MEFLVKQWLERREDASWGLLESARWRFSRMSSQPASDTFTPMPADLSKIGQFRVAGR